MDEAAQRIRCETRRPITLIAVTLLLVLVVGRLLHSGSPRNADYKRSWLANRS
jgi:hypothetical protein